MRRLLAKSADRGLLYLEQHTKHVYLAVTAFAKQYGFDVQLAQYGAVLHDLGKGHPVFQAMLINQPKENREYWLERLAGAEHVKEELRYRDCDMVPVHRHEYSSLAFLPLFPQAMWPDLIDMVVAHHKSVCEDKSGRGLLDLIYEEGGDSDKLIETHINYFDAWAPAVIEVASQFGVSKVDITEDMAREALRFATTYCQTLSKGWAPSRGLLMTADHFASGYQHATVQKVAGLFKIPSIKPYEERTKSNIAYLYPLSQISAQADQPHTLVTAPTGAGKTDFLVRRCQNRIFYTLPFQASINAMFKRFIADFPEADVRRVHSASKVNLDILESKKATKELWMEDIDLQHHPGASIKVMTPHQLSALVYGTPGHESIALDVRGQDIILDEIHTFNDKSQRMVIEVVKRLLSLDCRLHIGTATLPSALKQKLLNLMGGLKSVYDVSLSPDGLDDFDRHIIHKTHHGTAITPESVYTIVDQAIAEKEKVLIIANQVQRAQSIYEKLKKHYEDRQDIEIVLIHSRYRRRDRAYLESKVIDLQSPKRGDVPAIAVATQVVEVSLDISYDRMITEAAPLDALIQRFGRVNRKRKPKHERELRPIHIVRPSEKKGDVLPYDIEVVRRSYDVLPDGEIFKERNTQQYLDQVYPEIEVHAITDAYQYDEDAGWRLKKLEHRPRSVIIEALEIEGQRCILQSEVEEYRKAGFKEKPLFEIPVPGNFNNYNHLQIEQSGSFPLILPDERYKWSTADMRGLISDKDINIESQMC